MTKAARLENVGSRWDARHLINTVMGLLCRRESPDADTVIDVMTAAVRGYVKGHYGKSSHLKEAGVYLALKDYAWERIYRKRKDSALMEEFVNIAQWAEES
ncbi:hypothetical protein FIM07_03465, partial [SAR202 cluster bacterium AD-802-F09_MRT_200m]|nr:hypothetical protein [SAR202 cluster bacterium AD-802-F09_MRT_200m]